MIFAAGGSLDDGKRFYADVKSRMKTLGRSPDHLKILPGAFVIVGDTVDDAKKKKALLDSLVHAGQWPRVLVDCARMRCFGL